MTTIRAGILVLALTAPAIAQVRPLPAVSSTEWPADAVQTTAYVQPAQPVSSPNYPIDISPSPSLEEFQATQSQVNPPPAHPPVGKDGFLQQLAFQSTYLPQLSKENGLGVTDLELSATGALPCPTRDSPLLITPYFAAHFVEGPAQLAWYGPFGRIETDSIPPVLYDVQVDFRWLRKWNEYFGTDISLTPGLHSDFQTTEDAFRLKVQTIGAYDWSPTAKLVLGVAYLDRNDVNWLPIGGIVWTPNDDIRWELVFPRPKLAQRIRWDGHVEDWWYVAGEIGGDQWAIEQHARLYFAPNPFFFPFLPASVLGTRHNVVTTRDYRVMLGLERNIVGGISSRFEIGYVFARTIEFEHGEPDFDPDPTLMVRAGVAW